MDYETAENLAERLHNCETVDGDVVLIENVADGMVFEWQEEFQVDRDNRYEVEFYSVENRVLKPEVLSVLEDAEVSVYAATGDDWFRTQSN